MIRTAPKLPTTLATAISVALASVMTVAPVYGAQVSASQIATVESTSEETSNRTLVWPDGTRYVGGVLDGKRSGKGTIYWRDGTRFVGNFENDLRNGPGTMILPDGTVYEGFFENDTLVQAPGDLVADTGTANAATTTGSAQEAAPVVETSAAAVSTAAASAAAASAAAATAAATPPPQREPGKELLILTDVTRAEVEATVNEWAADWSRQRVRRYLNYYSNEFKVPGQQSRTQWETLRRTRVSRPASINVGIAFESLEIVEPGRIRVIFNQTYTSDLYSDETRKQMLLRKERDGAWRILSEVSL